MTKIITILWTTNCLTILQHKESWLFSYKIHLIKNLKHISINKIHLAFLGERVHCDSVWKSVSVLVLFAKKRTAQHTLYTRLELSFGFIYAILIILSVKKWSFTATYITTSIILHCVHASGLCSIFYSTVTTEKNWKRKKNFLSRIQGRIQKIKRLNDTISKQPLTFSNHH